MNRERRHALHEIEGEIRGIEIEVREQLPDEPDEEARAELVKAASSLIDAAEHILAATEVESEPAAAPRRTRKQRDAPEETEEV